tara:strand:+ start:1879 stop:3537 length:1659 start_codon:yes stop_codon:yes gene_type:complete
MLAGQIIKELDGLVKIMGSKEVRIIFEGEDASTDGNNVYLPSLSLLKNLSSKQVSVLRGLFDHECGHIRHTDFEAVEHSYNNKNSEVISLLFNVIEDCRINSIVSKEMPGAKINLETLFEDSINKIVNALEEIEKTENHKWLSSEKFWAPLSIFLTDGEKYNFSFESYKNLLKRIPLSLRNKAKLLQREIEEAKNSFEALDAAIHAAHIFGLTPDKLTKEEEELYEEIIEFFKKTLLTYEIAKNSLLSESDYQENHSEKSNPITKLPNHESDIYKIYSTEFDLISSSKYKGLRLKSKLKPELVRNLQLLVQTECAGFRELSELGKRIDPKSLVKAYKGESKVFLKKTLDKDIDTAIGILVDASGSMWGEKINMASLAAFELAAGLESFPISLEVAYFRTGKGIRFKNKNIGLGQGYRLVANELHIVKSWHQSTRQRNKYFSGMEKDVGGANADGESLLEFSNRIAVRPEKRKIIIVLSDGLPSCGVGYPAEEIFLKKAIKNITTRNIKLGAIGINCDHVRNYYPIYSEIKNIEKLPTALGDLTEKMLRISIS